jgi:hypothetical protein
MIGMFSAGMNRERLAQIEEALRVPDLPDEVRAQLRDDRQELVAWFMDLWRIEGGGA